MSNPIINCIFFPQLVAYHESGHAIVALHTPGAQPIQKVTILPRGSFLGMVSQVAAQDNASFGKKQILASLDICLGGRVAQELIYGDQGVKAGSEQDLITAREMAHNMVTISSVYWGIYFIRCMKLLTIVAL